MRPQVAIACITASLPGGVFELLTRRVVQPTILHTSGTVYVPLAHAVHLVAILVFGVTFAFDVATFLWSRTATKRTVHPF